MNFDIVIEERDRSFSLSYWVFTGPYAEAIDACDCCFRYLDDAVREAAELLDMELPVYPVRLSDDIFVVTPLTDMRPDHDRAITIERRGLWFAR